MKFILLFFTIFFLHQPNIKAQSVYANMPVDSKALYFTPKAYNIEKNGKYDVSEALQNAINTVKKSKNFGILFIPERVNIADVTILPKAQSAVTTLNRS